MFNKLSKGRMNPYWYAPLLENYYTPLGHALSEVLWYESRPSCQGLTLEVEPSKKYGNDAFLVAGRLVSGFKGRVGVGGTFLGAFFYEHRVSSHLLKAEAVRPQGNSAVFTVPFDLILGGTLFESFSGGLLSNSFDLAQARESFDVIVVGASKEKPSPGCDLSFHGYDDFIEREQEVHSLLSAAAKGPRLQPLPKKVPWNGEPSVIAEMLLAFEGEAKVREAQAAGRVYEDTLLNTLEAKETFTQLVLDQGNLGNLAELTYSARLLARS